MEREVREGAGDGTGTRDGSMHGRSEGGSKFFTGKAGKRVTAIRSTDTGKLREGKEAEGRVVGRRGEEVKDVGEATAG